DLSGTRWPPRIEQQHRCEMQVRKHCIGFRTAMQSSWEGEAPAEPDARLGGSLALPMRTSSRQPRKDPNRKLPEVGDVDHAVVAGIEAAHWGTVANQLLDSQIAQNGPTGLSAVDYSHAAS